MKDIVKIGFFSIGSQNCVSVLAYGYDFSDEVMITFNILNAKMIQMDLFFIQSKVKLDFMIEQ